MEYKSHLKGLIDFDKIIGLFQYSSIFIILAMNYPFSDNINKK